MTAAGSRETAHFAEPADPAEPAEPIDPAADKETTR